ncbi:hypothetical protein BT_0660 [Bartonella tribocorum CIP 105476]|uniref:Uncharacterized protein n=1 Tax=Bartonella tribocorum (strain DSM 28219 / CCUG 45778 / CIP 105476 / IBS 506) TaxID=382640 RepID=A9IQS2_BART1|nr:hypothetical protein BT_0660 [Bartonella tribocorum CIP 105476]
MHITSRESPGEEKTILKGGKCLFMNRLKSQKLSQYWKLENMTIVPSLLLYKRKDGGAQWMYHNTTHKRLCKIALDTLRDVSLKEKHKR